MIAEDGEYIITYTADEIRAAAMEPLTDEQCDSMAEELAALFDDYFGRHVRNAMALEVME